LHTGLADAGIDRPGLDAGIDADITDIIPFDEFGSLDDLDFGDDMAAFGNAAQVLQAPELDDMDDADDLRPVRLAVPSAFRADTAADRAEDPHPYRSHGAVDGSTRGIGAHRAASPANAVKGRLLIAAMAAGAAAAAAHTLVNDADTQANPAILAAGESTIPGGTMVEGASGGMQLITVMPAANAAVHQEELVKGLAFAQERAEREARLQRPLYVKPTTGIPMSAYGMRWGVLHGGIDIANSIGTPIYAVSDGIVIDAGPTAGYGMWVKLRHSDGTVTLYGHINTALVNIGEKVMAGDQIATMGNRGNSTGPHLHFEVLLNGTNRIDPVGWLSQRGLPMNGFTG